MKHHQTQASSQSVVQKVNFTPFLPSNKLPGRFVPIQAPMQHNSQYGSSNVGNHDENHNDNNLVYQNNNNGGSSSQFSGNGGGSVIENTLTVTNHQNYNNDQKLSAGKAAIAATIFVTSTPR